jgi:hypothetical protein
MPVCRSQQQIPSVHPLVSSLRNDHVTELRGYRSKECGWTLLKCLKDVNWFQLAQSCIQCDESSVPNHYALKKFGGGGVRRYTSTH